MQHDAPDGPSPVPALRTPRSWVRGLAIAVLVAVLLGAAFLGGALVSGAWGLFDLLRTANQTTTVTRPMPSVVVAVRDLARLETTTFHIERVIDRTDEQPLLGGLLRRKDAILLVAAADVTAGVDLGRLEDGDVVADGAARTVRITLPEPEILSTVLDGERTYVHTRSTDLLARRSEKLEAEARREAEQTLRQAALDAGVLDRARAGAERSLRGLLRSMGYETIEIRWR